MVKDLKKQRTKDGKVFWSFRLLVEVDGMPLEVSGWKWFEKSGVVRPPQVLVRGQWIPTISGVKGPLEEKIRAAVLRALPEGVVKPPAPVLAIVEVDPRDKRPDESWVEYRKREATFNAC